jgi:nicotinamide-nucleotide amidase
LKALAAGQVVVIGKVMCFGAGESAIADKLGDLMQRGRNPLINSTASAGVITLHIVAAAGGKGDAEEMVERHRAQLVEILGDLVYGYDGQSLAEVVGAALKERNKTLAVAESCTGGLLGKLITDVPGASDYFKCGWITYCNEAKISELGIRAELIEEHGAVSEEVCLAMAQAARVKAGSDYAVGITGIAGPGGATEQKPVGLVYISLDCAEKSLCRKHIFSHSRQNVRLGSAMTALNMLRTEM